MKKIKNFLGLIIVLMVYINCTNDDNDLSFVENVAPPSEVSAHFLITQDNTGRVKITPNSVGGVSYVIDLGDGSETVSVERGGNVEHVYPEGTYTIGIEATGITGLKTEGSQELPVYFVAPENLVIKAEIDPSNPFKVNVSAAADFAASFLVYFDTSNPDEEPTPLEIEGTVSYEYPTVGDYTIKVVALSGGTETTEGTEVITIETPTELPIDFEIFDATAFIGFGGATNAVIDNPDTNGNTSTKVGQIIKGAGEVWAGNVIILSAPIDFSNKKLLKLDVWSPRPAGNLLVKLENLNDNTIFIEKTVSLQGNSSWEDVVVDFSDIDITQQYQKIVFFFDFGTVGDGSTDWTFYIDNIRLESAAPFNDGLLTNGDFEDGSNGWIVGVDDNSPVTVVTDSENNTYYSVNVTTAGNPWEVNMSQKVEIIQDETYTLIFDAWSDTNRSIIAGIGLSGDPWSNTVEPVNITPTRTTFTLTLTASGWGAINARVLFDMGANVGIVNIDNVSLFLGDGPFDDGLLTNGDFEAGSDPWIVGVDDNTPITVVTDSGNTYYSVDVAVAGNPWEVNMSQKLEIISGKTYTLSFDAWSDTNRPIIAGIGLSGDPWSSETQTVNITPTKQTYTLTLTATSWGAPNARVIFDMGAAAGQVNIDNVSLFTN